MRRARVSRWRQGGTFIAEEVHSNGHQESFSQKDLLDFPRRKMQRNLRLSIQLSSNFLLEVRL